MACDAGRCYRTRGTSIPTSNLIVRRPPINRGAGNTQGFYVPKSLTPDIFIRLSLFKCFLGHDGESERLNYRHESNVVYGICRYKGL